jgi:phytol kinase
MTQPFQELVRFFAANCPDASALAVGGPAALAWAAACLLAAGILKARLKLKTGYTRKVFHFLIFGTVVVIHWLWGTPGVCLFGGMTTVVIAYALLKGSGHIMYEAMARETDAPRRTYYIVIPYFATLIGGLLTNILFPATAVFGYLVTGLGDAVAEPVGTRFGKHKYRVPSAGGVRATRSVEGSSAVFIASALALTACLALSPQFDLSGGALLIILLVSFASTVVEAVSPHGWDNTTLQVVPALLGTVFNVTGS